MGDFRSADTLCVPEAKSMSIWAWVGVFVLITTILAGARAYEFLLFHVIVEIFSVIVAICIFAIAWNTRHIVKTE